jgi:S1-C subfamily serine protease
MSTSELLARADRVFGGRSPDEVARDYRALVGPTNSADQRVKSALDALRAGREPSPLELVALEEAMRLYRPVAFASGGKVEALPLGSIVHDSWGDFSDKVSAHLFSIGRIDRGPQAPSIVPQKVGTGFLVRPDLMVTNRHVLEMVSVGTMRLDRGMATVHFGHEHDVANDEDPFDVIGVVAVHPVLDMVLLRIDTTPSRNGRAPLVLGTTPADSGAPLVVIGYPLQDSVRNPLFENQLFGGVFGVKRLSPGELIGRQGDVLHHDCSTLGGNSGSPVLDMATGSLVGIHFHGSFCVRNSAIASSAFVPFITEHAA